MSRRRWGLRSGGHDRGDPRGGLLWPAGGAGWLPLLCLCHGRLPHGPSAHPYLIPSHLSAEKGAQIALDALGLRPYLDMDMRTGEGSGAALAMHLLDAASVMYNQMGTLAQSNIVLPDSAPSS